MLLGHYVLIIQDKARTFHLWLPKWVLSDVAQINNVLARQL